MDALRGGLLALAGAVLGFLAKPVDRLIGVAATPNEGLVPERDSGVLLIGVGVMDWLARKTVGAPLRGLLWRNLFVRVAALAVNGWDLAAGMLPASPPGLVSGALGGFSIASIIVFALALRRA